MVNSEPTKATTPTPPPPTVVVCTDDTHEQPDKQTKKTLTKFDFYVERLSFLLLPLLLLFTSNSGHGRTTHINKLLFGRLRDRGERDRGV